jgi:hypothetical protein
VSVTLSMAPTTILVAILVAIAHCPHRRLVETCRCGWL